MRKVWQIMGKTTVILLWAVFCFAVFEVCIIVFNLTPAKWYARLNCLCGRAHFHAGEHFLPDDMLFNEIGQQELSDEQILIFTQHCRRHNEGIIITIYGSKEYSVQGRSQ